MSSAEDGMAKVASTFTPNNNLSLCYRLFILNFLDQILQFVILLIFNNCGKIVVFFCFTIWMNILQIIILMKKYLC